jgi:hypothetical protein
MRVALKVALTVELTGVELAERWVWPLAAKKAVLMGVLLVGTTACLLVAEWGAKRVALKVAVLVALTVDH